MGGAGAVTIDCIFVLMVVGGVGGDCGGGCGGSRRSNAALLVVHI